MKRLCFVIVSCMVALCMEACSPIFNSEEGSYSKTVNFQELRKTYISMDDSVLISSKSLKDSLGLTYMDSIVGGESRVTYQLTRQRTKLDLYIDIYGCFDMYCSTANMVVFRTGNYEKSKSLKKGKFEFSKPNRDFISADEFGTDCKLNVYNFFRLKIDQADVQVDWTVQESRKTCEVTYYY